MSVFVPRPKAVIQRLDARTLRIAATAGASYVARFGSGIAVIVTLPMARQELHPELFGVWMMLSALLAFMAFADLGIGNGVLNRITRAQAADDRDELRRTLASGYACTCAAGVALMLAWQAWSLLASDPTAVAGAISAPHRADVLAALTVFVGVLAVNIPASLIQRVQLGMQQGYWAGIAQFFGALLTLAAVPLTLRHGGGVVALVLATLGVQVGVNVVNTLVWFWHQQLLNPAQWHGAWDAATTRSLLQSGGMFFLLQLAVAFAFQSDAIVITQTLGQVAYGEFAVVQKLFLFVSMLLSTAMVALWPAFGDAMARNDIRWARKALRRSAAIAAGISIISVTVLAAAMPWIMAHWMQGTISPAWGLVVALAVWTVIEAVASVLGAFMNGANILRAQVVFALGMALTAFTGKWLLTPILGAAGATLSTILAYCLISVPGLIYIFRRIFAQGLVR